MSTKVTREDREAAVQALRAGGPAVNAWVPDGCAKPGLAFDTDLESVAEAIAAARSSKAEERPVLDWKIQGQLVATVRNERYILLVLIEPLSLTVTALQSVIPDTSDTVESQINHSLKEHSHRVLGTGNDLLDAMRLATEFTWKWQGETADACGCSDIGVPE